MYLSGREKVRLSLAQSLLHPIICFLLAFPNSLSSWMLRTSFLMPLQHRAIPSPLTVFQAKPRDIL